MARWITVFFVLAAVTAAAADTRPPPSGPPPTRPPGPPPTPRPQVPDVVQVTPVIKSAKQGLTARDTVTVRGTLPNEGPYTFAARGAFSATTKIAQVTLAITVPRDAVMKRNPQEFTQSATITELNGYKGDFTIVVVAPDGTELHRFDKARM